MACVMAACGLWRMPSILRPGWLPQRALVAKCRANGDRCSSASKGGSIFWPPPCCFRNMRSISWRDFRRRGICGRRWAVGELEHEWALGGFGAGPVEACGGFDHLVLVDDLPAEPWGRFRAGSPAIVLVAGLPRWSGTSPGARMSAGWVLGIFWSRCSVFRWHWARSRTWSRSFPRRWPFPTRRRCVGRR